MAAHTALPLAPDFEAHATLRPRNPPLQPADDRTQRIYATVDSIPKGSVATYGQVAEQAGLPRRARLVGKLLRDLPRKSTLPWHRVINATGRISVRTGDGAARQRRLLRSEGIKLNATGRVDLQIFGWQPED